MTVSAVNNANETNYTAAANEALRETNSDLGKDAFLKILITQLSNQDPLDPLKDKDFIAQMAQFSTLEQMTNMNKSIEQMNALTKGSAVNYIGRVVESALGYYNKSPGFGLAGSPVFQGKGGSMD